MVGQASSLSLDSGYFRGADPRSARVPWTRSSASAARPLAVFALPPLENRTELFDNRKAKGGEFLRKVKPSRNGTRDRKSTRLNSSHLGISYAVFCLKKKK